MRVLIVGCGYVGLPLGAQLVSAGHEVYGVRRDPGAAGQLRAAGVKFLSADITKPQQLAGLTPGYDWVVNCVSSTRGNAPDYRAVYLEGTRNLVTWLAQAPPQKFVYTSSTSVYGQTDGSIVTEASQADPASELAKVLVETEQVLREASRDRIPAVILRLAGIYGPGRGYWLQQFLKGEARLEGDGSRWLNLIHRSDVVGSVIRLLEIGLPGETYNGVDDEPVTQFALFEWLAKQLDRPLPPAEPASSARERKRAFTDKRVSNHKLRRELGYSFSYPTFREGFRQELGRTGLFGGV